MLLVNEPIIEAARRGIHCCEQTDAGIHEDTKTLDP